MLEGETLRELLNDGSLSTRKAIDYGTQIARGLAAAPSPRLSAWGHAVELFAGGRRYLGTRKRNIAYIAPPAAIVRNRSRILVRIHNALDDLTWPCLRMSDEVHAI